MAKKDRLNVKEIDKEINEDLTREQIEAMTGTGLPKGKMLVSGAGFWDFETANEFRGTYLGKKVFDPNEPSKLMGYDFVSDDGEMIIIGASHSIVKAMEMDTGNGEKVEDLTEPHLFIRFEGKMLVKKSGRQFSKFTVMLLD